MTEQGIGARVLRKEDFRFVKGRGKYTDDITLPNQTYATIICALVVTASGMDTTAGSSE